MLSPSVNRKAPRKACGGQNIKVFTRCRPMNSIEKASRSHSIVSCPTSREITVKERLNSSKTFSFDRVFGPDSKQIDVYKAVAKPLVEEVTNGFNCTIFAYGQTGTGKTYTMEGERSEEVMNWDEDPQAGIIPRCVNHLFDELRVQKVEFTMRVSFLELYNEEIFDLLSAHDDMSKLRLYEDGSRKGSCIIQSLEEVLVRSKSDVYNVIAKGSAKRQTAATLMNAHSSRSHTVFTVTVHIKENTLDGDELLKTGKLHLVDLAGSENIGRSGAVDKRAREAGNINQSLLTLGRVITSLVEKAPHIPYRESKLTRLLQDALGGKTKTSIIATVSPASVNMEESLSTLDYAHRAKNIQNKPEVNQKLNKKELIGEYSVEIDRLRRDLLAMREKNGVYLANENYEDMVNTIEQQTQEISEKISQIRQLEEDLEQKMELFNETSLQLEKTSDQLVKTETKLSDTREVLSTTKKWLEETSADRDEKKCLLEAHMTTETKLQEEGRNLINTVDVTTADIKKLQDKLERSKSVEQTNKTLVEKFQSDYKNKAEVLVNDIVYFNNKKDVTLSEINSNLTSTAEKCTNKMMDFSSQMTDLSQMASNMFSMLSNMQEDEAKAIQDKTSSFVSSTVSNYEEQSSNFSNFQMKHILPALQVLANIISTQSVPITNIQKLVTDGNSDVMKQCEECCQRQDKDTGDVDNEVVDLKLKSKDHSNSCKETIINIKENLDKFSKCCLDKLDLYQKETTDKIDETTTMIQETVNKFQEATNKIQEDLNIFSKSCLQKKNKLDAEIKGFVEETNNILSKLDNLEIENDDNVEKSLSLISNKVNNVRTYSYDQVAQVNKIQNEAKESIDDQIDNLENGLRQIGEQRCTIETSVSTFSSELSSVYTDNTQTMKAFDETLSLEVTKHQNSYREANNEEKLKLNKSIEKSKSNIASSCEEWATDIVNQVSLMNQLKEDTNHTLTSVIEDINKKSVAVQSLVKQEMVQDKPTGGTPARRDYSYSRTLPATSPHERILERFRNNRYSNNTLSTFSDCGEDLSINSTTGDPFSPGSVGDQSNSGSLADLRAPIPLSRSDSASDKDEGVFLLPSLPHSCNTSEEFIKPTSRPISRSSSASSLNDSKENKPIQRKGSFSKKRELKQPTNYTQTQEKTRKVLGNVN